MCAVEVAGNGSRVVVTHQILIKVLCMNTGSVCFYSTANTTMIGNEIKY